MIEEWRDIPEYEGLYKVSSLGNVKRLKRTIYIKNYNTVLEEMIIKQQLDKSVGYYMVGLHKDRRSKSVRIHQLVAMAFLGHIPDKFKLVIDHIDGNKTNNIVSNLRIVTNRDNNSVCKRVNDDLFTSKFVGVHWSKHENKWQSCIRYKNKKFRVGASICEITASEMYQKALYHIVNNSFEAYYDTIKRKNSSAHKGVFINRRRNRWGAQIRINGKTIRIGEYKTEHEAIEAYDNLCKNIKL